MQSHMKPELRFHPCRVGIWLTRRRREQCQHRHRIAPFAFLDAAHTPPVGES